MIVATAGHVDHGKTSLIKQLTGVDTDRLEEEKRRGLSINLGYAYRKVTGCSPVGFVDVPGHTRFINTMIAGISGIDLGMLVVAADDGIMPQTREHVDVLRLLGVTECVLVVSKIDRVDAARVDEVSRAAAELLAQGTEVSVFSVDNISGAGIEALWRHLERRAQGVARRNLEGGFRLSIDRAFNLKGAGLVVTGTATAGALQLGDSLTLLPHKREVRVRSLHVQDQEAASAGAGERCALNLAGDVSKSDIERGDWLVTPGLDATTARFDARVQLLANAPFNLRHLAPVKLHLGAKRLAARMALLEPEVRVLKPGDTALVQLILEQEIACCHGERFLLRDDSESFTLGGGRVLDTMAPQRGKSTPARLSWLQGLDQQAPLTALQALAIEQERVVDLDRFLLNWNLLPEWAESVPTADFKRFAVAGAGYLVSATVWQHAAQELHNFVRNWHQQNPREAGILAPDLQSALAVQIDAPLLQALLAAGLAASELLLRDGRIGLAAHLGSVTSVADERWQQYEVFLRERDKDIPLLSELMTLTGWDRRRAETVARNAVRDGHLLQLTETRYATPELMHRLALIVTEMAAAGEPLTVVNFKTRMDTGRKVAIEVLEYFDQIGFTERRDNERFVIAPELPASAFKR